jgi:hypothetical protein
MKEIADKYTVKPTHLDSITKIIKACMELDLYYFIMPERGTSKCRIYIFFDEAGMKNYMRGYYENENT